MAVQNHILPTYNLINSYPPNFEIQVLALQDNYLSFRKKTQGPLLEFQQKMKLLKVLAKNLIESDNSGLNYEIFTWAAINLLEIYLLFKDDQITEIYLNGINTQISLYHRHFGRMTSDLLFSDELWISMKLQSELNSNQVLSRMNPSLKTGFETDLGNIRITLQIPPLSQGPIAVVRRLPKQPLTVNNLILQGQVPNDYIKFLLSALNERKNIIIAGEPGSGKTTLANALLIESPIFWRLIVMEDASEIRLDHQRFPLLVKFSIPSVGKKSVVKRENEIAKLLHRSPDYVFLGEIQDKMDTVTMFEAFSAGISGMATTHSKNLFGLLMRWKDNYDISSNLLSSIDVIVVTKKIWLNNIQSLTIHKVYHQTLDGFKEMTL